MLSLRGTPSRTEHCALRAVLPLLGRTAMSLGTILLILLLLMLVGAIPSWPHSRSWGYGPSGGLGLVLIVLLILWLTGKI